jgi:hypothetical protein
MAHARLRPSRRDDDRVAERFGSAAQRFETASVDAVIVSQKKLHRCDK